MTDLKPWLYHHGNCACIDADRAESMLGYSWRDGDEATCTCGLAQALSAPAATYPPQLTKEQLDDPETWRGIGDSYKDALLAEPQAKE